MKINCNNKNYFELALEAKGIEYMKPENAQKMVDELDGYAKVYNKSIAHKQIMIKWLPAGELFRQKLRDYIRPLVIKGVPSVINDLKYLYKQS